MVSDERRFERRFRFSTTCPRCSSNTTSNFSKSDLEESLVSGELEHFCSPCRYGWKEKLDDNAKQRIRKVVEDKF